MMMTLHSLLSPFISKTASNPLYIQQLELHLASLLFDVPYFLPKIQTVDRLVLAPPNITFLPILYVFIETLFFM